MAEMKISGGGEKAVAITGGAVWVNVSLLGCLLVAVSYATHKLTNFEAVVTSGNTKLSEVTAGLSEVRAELSTLAKGMAHMDGSNGALARRVDAIEAEVSRLRDEDRKIWESLRK